MKRFLTYFGPPILLSLVIWVLLVGSQIFSEGYSDCKQFGLHDSTHCSDYNIALGISITAIVSGAAFLTATLLYLAKRAWLKDQKTQLAENKKLGTS